MACKSEKGRAIFSYFFTSRKTKISYNMPKLAKMHYSNTAFDIKGPIIYPAQCGARSGASVFASFSPTQFSFSHPALRCLNSKCICAHLCTHGRAGLKKVCSGALLARCYFEELKIDCAIDQLKPGLKSKVNGAIFLLFFKKCVSRKCTSGRVHNAHSLCLLHTGQQHTNMPNIKN